MQQISLVGIVSFLMLLLQRLHCSFSRQSVGLLVSSVAGVTRNVHLKDEEEGEEE